jgi:aryl-alcohol dehydrogenase-like predicted oxidoreductase
MSSEQRGGIRVKMVRYIWNQQIILEGSLMATLSAAAAGTVALGSYSVRRLGYGAMRITGPGIWGPPSDHDAAIAVLRRTVELGIDFIDTADSYGPYVSEELIKEALHPYPEGLVIATKVGFVRTGPNKWIPVGRPEYLRQEVEMSLRRLGLDRIDLMQLHRVDPQVPLADQVGELRLMQEEGKIVHIGLSEVGTEVIDEARKTAEIVSVQNMYNLVSRQSEDVMAYCEREGLAFIPWFPIATGQLAAEGSLLTNLAKEYDATPAQLALAWLLHRSPAMLPIPGTMSVAHLEENVAGAAIRLTGEQYEALTALA